MWSDRERTVTCPSVLIVIWMLCVIVIKWMDPKCDSAMKFMHIFMKINLKVNTFVLFNIIRECRQSVHVSHFDLVNTIVTIPLIASPILADLLTIKGLSHMKIIYQHDTGQTMEGSLIKLIVYFSWEEPLWLLIFKVRGQGHNGQIWIWERP